MDDAQKTSARDRAKDRLFENIFRLEDEVARLRAGLAASQARERKLRKALAEAMEWNWMDDDAGEIIPAWVRETLCPTTDDSDLREMIAAGLEACAMIADDYDPSDDSSMCEVAEGIAAEIRARKIEYY